MIWQKYIFYLLVCWCSGYGPQKTHLAAFTNPLLNLLSCSTEHHGVFCPYKLTPQSPHSASSANSKLEQSSKLERRQRRAVGPYKTQAHVELLKMCRVAAWNGNWAMWTTWEGCQMLTKVSLHASKKILKPICSEMLQEALELNNRANLS